MNEVKYVATSALPGALFIQVPMKHVLIAIGSAILLH
jgi:hypothetical protein